MIRILHMTPPEVSNGVYRYIFNHMPYIDQSKYEFSFLTKSADSLKKTREYEVFRFPVYQLDTVQRDGREAFAREIRNVLGRGFDVVHLHTSSWRGFLIEEIAMEMKVPKVIVHSHSSGIDFVDPAEREKLWRDHVHYKSRFSMDYATDICACSHVAADWLFPESVPRDRIQILPNAVDVQRFRYHRETREAIRGRLGIGDRVVVGHIGRYSYAKNQEFLVRCFARAYEKDKRLYLILMGQGENISVVKKLVEELGMQEQIACYGWREDTPDFLQAMDVFCLPSRFEGLPISVIEAQAAGLRCLVSDLVTEEVDITGLVEFLPLEEDCWAEALAEAAKTGDLAVGNREGIWKSRLDEAFRQTGYSIEASCEKLSCLYDTALSCSACMK